MVSTASIRCYAEARAESRVVTTIPARELLIVNRSAETRPDGDWHRGVSRDCSVRLDDTFRTFEEFAAAQEYVRTLPPSPTPTVPPMSAAAYREQRNQIATAMGHQSQVISTLTAPLRDAQQRMLARTANMEVKRQIAQARMLRAPRCYASHREVEVRYLDALEQATDNALAAFQAADDGNTVEATAHLSSAAAYQAQAAALLRTANALLEAAQC